MRRTGASKSATATDRAGRIAAFVALVASVPALAQSQGERITTLEARMAAVERKLENQGLLEMSRQIEALNQELRSLRGEIEKLQHELETARRQQKDQYLDLDTRLRAAETALASGPVTGPAGSPEAEYQAAFELLKSGRYDEAATALSEFVSRHRDHELASNGLYWLGEAHYVRRAFADALAAFEGVLKAYPDARKRPDAMLKAAYCQYELKRYGPARATLTQLAKEFPDAPAAAEGNVRLARMKAEGH